jgi:hypothetical protein
MAKGKSKTPDSTPVDIRPGLTPEAEENQCIAMAYRLVKQRLADGSASSQETTHFLKMGSVKARLENERLKEENKLLQAKTKALESAEDMKELYAEAIKAMASYQGHGDLDNEEEY